MFKTLILLLPCSVCTIFTLVLLVRKGKSASETILTFIAAFTAIYFFSDANYLFPSSSYHSLVYTDLITQFVSPCIPIITYSYYRTLIGKNPVNHWVGSMIIPPVALFTIAFSLYYVIGIDTSADFIRAYDNPPVPEMFKTRIFTVLMISTRYVCNIIICIGIVYSIIYMFVQESRIRQKSLIATIKGFLFNKEKTGIHSLQALYITIILVIWAAKLSMTRNFALSHPIVMDCFSLISSLILILIFLTGLLPKGSELKFANMATPLTNIPDVKQEKPKEELAPAPALNYAESEEFFNFMENQEAFKQHGITISDVAMALHTNRTYLSIFLNKTLKMTFPEYLGNLRIDYAKKMLVQNPNESQAVIADACGFDSVATFSSKFKKITGMTPGQYAAGIKVKG
ncbi:MAG: helix-turn-helix transcriptional regulator [Bacteroidales bacterium]|nr:helix-turn-helix transcriptional regulator [Bacteroidales bacterium]